MSKKQLDIRRAKVAGQASQCNAATKSTGLRNRSWMLTFHSADY